MHRALKSVAANVATVVLDDHIDAALVVPLVRADAAAAFVKDEKKECRIAPQWET